MNGDCTYSGLGTWTCYGPFVRGMYSITVLVDGDHMTVLIDRGDDNTFQINIKPSAYSSPVHSIMVPFGKSSLICNVYGATLGLDNEQWRDVYFNESADVSMVYIKLNAPVLYESLEKVWNEERERNPMHGSRIV